jgi:ribosomal protein S18 acetylase RimI-like enzyme
MMNEAARPAVGHIVLRGDGLVCRARAWPTMPDTAQLVMYQQIRPPTSTDLARWIEQLAELGFARIRTSALATAASRRVELAGFQPIQELVLLQHDEPRRAPRPKVATARLLTDRQAEAAHIDRAAFGVEWSLDINAIDDVRRATPAHRARTAGGTTFQAYAITGRDARQGFLQRLAVAPELQGQGLGTALVLDSLRWSGRWRADRVLVNTPTTNQVALGLYERVGFHRLTERLRVYERSLP